MHPTAADWEGLLETQRLLQRHFPDLVLVGGTAAALYAHHRFSLDGDHVLADLRNHFDEVLHKLEDMAGWQTNRIRPPVLILGRLSGIDTGIRQLRRQAPLETTEIAGLRVPTRAEMLRIKAWLVVTRNAFRDYLDFCALADGLTDEDVVQALRSLDQLYPQPTGEPVCRQLAKQLAEPHPYDLTDPASIRTYKGIQAPWDDWEHVLAVARHHAQTLFRYLLQEENDAASPPE